MSQMDSKFTTGLHEPMKFLLQKEIEIAISQYEEERRNEQHLDSKIKDLENELERLKNLKKSEENIELLAVVNSLKKKLEVSQTHFNTTQNENLLIRNKIDHLRIVTASNKIKVKSLETDIEKSKNMAKLKFLEQTKEKNSEKEKLSEIRLVMSKSANEKIRYTQKLEAISTFIKKEKFETFNITKKITENLQGILNKKLKVLDNTKIIEKLCERLDGEIKKLNYKVNKRKQHNAKLNELFESIKSHSEIKSTDEFVEVFLNFYEESTQLSKYLLEVFAEIESLEFANKKIEANYDESNQFLYTSRSKASKISNELSQNMKKTYSLINSSIKHQNLIKEQLDKIKIWLEKSISLGTNFDPLHTKSLSENIEGIEEHLMVLEELVHSIKIFNLCSTSKDFAVKSITLSPTSNRRPTPDINFKNNQIKEFLTSRDLIDDFPDDEKGPQPLETLRERARLLLENNVKDRTRTPPPQRHTIFIQ